MNPLKLTARLIDHRDGLRDLLKTVWNERVAQHGEQLRARMAAMETTNALAAAVSLGKEMAARGEDPGMLIAVAVEMCERQSAADLRVDDEIARRQMRRHFGEEE